MVGSGEGLKGVTMNKGLLRRRENRWGIRPFQPLKPLQKEKKQKF